MTTSPPKIFDHPALNRSKARAARRQARRGPSFLYTRVAEDAASRLEDINRRFDQAVLIGAVDGREAILQNLRADRHPAQFDHIETMEDLEGRYDVVFSLLELQSDERLPDTLSACRKKLSPDGLFLAATFGGETLNELRQSLYATDQQVFGGATARVYPMVDYSQAAMLLGRIGLALPVVDTDRFTVHYGQLNNLFADLRDLGLSNVLLARDKRPLTRKWRRALDVTYSEHFARADGKFQATFEVLWLTGWAPHASQQQPLKPGSAKMRLADALNAKETKLK